MKKLATLALAAAATFTIGNANAVVLGLDSFDDAATTASGPVVDVLNNDLFDTRALTCTDAGGTCALDVDTSVPGALNYGVTNPSPAQYNVLYTFASAVDLTSGKGSSGAADFLQLQVQENDFPFQLSIAVNGGGFETFSNTSSFFNTPPGTLDSFALSELTASLIAVNSLEFQIVPVTGPGSTTPANQADGVLTLAQFDLEEAPVVTVPVPSGILMLVAGLLGMRQIRKSA